MGKRYGRISYSDHAERQFAERPLVAKEDVELALNEGVIRKGEGQGLIAEYAVRDRLAVRVIFFEVAPESAFVVTFYPIRRRRTKA
ncbi:MAG: hypothetical protein M3511_06245 [Deinococcota bacterium]|jgi:hypothetical protein|nr:hypothetical protein [Deinococcota bacterium]